MAALEAGADDYVTKPFGLAELRARIARLLRRAGRPGRRSERRSSRSARSCSTSPRRRVTVGGAPVDLTPREYELLKVDARPARAGCSPKARLLRAVWGTAYADEGALPPCLRQPAPAQARRRRPAGAARRPDRRPSRASATGSRPRPIRPLVEAC